jgi:hypothetical protein
MKNETATKYQAQFSFGVVTRTSHHDYKTAAVAVKGGKPYVSPTFSAKTAKAVMPGDSRRRSAKCRIYNHEQRTALLVEAAKLDEGWLVEVVAVTKH